MAEVISGRRVSPEWMRWVLRAAAGYNAAWGGCMMAFPHAWWDWIGQARPNDEFLWPGMGLMILLFGVGYWIASGNPARHWRLVAIGLASKVLTFLGTAAGCFVLKNVPVEFFWSGILNDLVWWFPFAIILRWGLQQPSSQSGVELCHEAHFPER